MATSYNGWPASKTLKTVLIEPVPGCKLRVLDDQTVVEIFTYLVQQFHARVDDVTKPHPADDWGYHYRPNVNNPSELSNHSSATAIDLDATEHPNKVATEKTFTAAQINEVHEILRELEGLVRWGGDYTNTKDAMHFELLHGPAHTRAVWSRIRAGLLHLDQKPVPEIADEVIRGEWGNGQERIDRLTRAGYNYAEVQAEVSRKLGVSVKPVPPPKKTITQLVQEVLDGQWGNGVERKQRLTKAGYDYDAVQAAVTRKLSTKKSVAQVASEVIAGQWGNGAVRISKLRAAGYDPKAVQAEVNRRL